MLMTGPALPNFLLPGKKAFLTSGTGTGNLGSWPGANGHKGIAAGDEICLNLAAGAGLQNAQHFKAWLSDSKTDASARFTSNGPWVRLDGLVLTENREDLTDGSLNTTLNLSETGDYIGIASTWTRTNRIGEKRTDTCNNWFDDTQSFNGRVGRIHDRFAWTFSGQVSCRSHVRLYCFED